MEALDPVQLECRRRGVDGVPEYVLYKGKVVMYEGAPLIRKRYSDTLILAPHRACAAVHRKI